MKKSISLAVTFFLITLNLLAQIQWSQLGTTAFNAPILTTTSDANGYVFAAGSFTNTSGNCYVAKWDGTSWSELGGLNGLSANGAINTIFVDASGNIYAAGSFKNASSKYYVAKYNGSSWSEVGGSNSLAANGVINSVCVDGSGNVYAAGNFTNANSYRYVAKFNGSSWSELGGANYFKANGPVLCLKVDPQNIVFAAGDFKNSNGKRYVAVYSSGWGELYNPLAYNYLGADSTINCIDYKYNSSSADDVFAAGLFSLSSKKKFVARYRTNKWDSVTSKVTTGDSALFPDATSIKGLFRANNGYLYAAFNHSGRCVVGKWDGNNWSELGGKNSLGATADINTLCADVYGNYFAAGNFTNAGGKYYVAKYGCKSFVTPSVSLGSQSTITSCKGSWLTLKATAQNPGNSPIYTFYVNGILAQQSSSNEFPDNAFMDNDSVYCKLTADNACQTIAAVESNTIKLVRNNCTSYYSFSKSICNNGSYFFNGQNLTQGGTYYDTLVNWKNADSMITLTLKVNPAVSHSFNHSICTGESVLFNGENLNQSGVYMDTLMNYWGCDSFVTMNLTVIPNSKDTIYLTICKGSWYQFNGQMIIATGIYKDTFQNYLGCDSFITLNAKVNALPISKFTLHKDSSVDHHWFLVNQCSGTPPLVYSWNWGDGSSNSSGETPHHTYDAAGTYNVCVDVTDTNGCSSNYCSLSEISRVSPNGSMVYLDVVKTLPILAGLNSLNLGKIEIYPNPTGGLTTIKLSKELVNGTLNIYNAQGQLVQQKTNQNGQIIGFDISTESKGIYFIQLQQNQGNWSCVLMKD